MKEQKKETVKKVTIVDVAKRSGVVPSTVSHVLNGTAQITEATRQRVMDAIRELDYKPNASARALRQKRTGLIGVALQDISSEFYAKCTASMLKESLKDKYALMVMDSCFENETLKAQVSAMIERRVEGIVFIGGGNDEEILQTVSNFNIPIVLGDRSGGKYSSVEFNNEESVYKLVLALYESGYRKFAYAGEPLEVQQNLSARFRGFVKGLDECRVPKARRLYVMTEELHRNKVSGAHRVFKKHFLDENGVAIPDVILTSNDMIAQGLIVAALEQGIRVPEDLGIVGFDDIEISKFFRPPVTTIAQDEAALGKQCYRLLKKEIEGTKEHEHVVLQQKIRNRETTQIPDEILKKYFEL